MSMITTILHKEKIYPDSRINILWTECGDPQFKEFISSIGYRLLSFADIYYAFNHPNIIICNDKVRFFDQCRALSIQFHLPVLLIDHMIKPNLLDKDKINDLNSFPCLHSVAISKKISESWNGFHDQILSYNKTNPESKNIWKNLIYQTTKKIFLI